MASAQPPGPRRSPGRGCEAYFVEEPGDIAPPLVPGAIWDRAAPGDPSERVESEASGVLVPPVPNDFGVNPRSLELPPGETRVSPVPGAICDLASPGEPSERVALLAAP